MHKESPVNKKSRDDDEDEVIPVFEKPFVHDGFVYSGTTLLYRRDRRIRIKNYGAMPCIFLVSG